MGKIGWCKKQKNGIRLVSSDLDIARGYLKMAEDSIGTMDFSFKGGLSIILDLSL